MLIALSRIRKLGLDRTTSLRHQLGQAHGWLARHQHLLFLEDHLLSLPAIACCRQLAQLLAHGLHCAISGLASYVRDPTATHTSIEHRLISRPGLHAHRVIGDAQFLPDDLAQHGVKAGAGIPQGRRERHRPIRRDHHFGY